MARTSLLSKMLLAALLGVAVRQLMPGQEAFMSPKLRGESAAAMAAAMLAASVAAPNAAEAAIPNFSFFGFGNGQSDAYSVNDNPTNPYSQFSDGTDSVYQKYSGQEKERKRTQLDAAVKRLEKTPELIRTKQAQQIKANLLEAGGTMKIAMNYFSGERDSPAWNKAREFSQRISDLGVSGGQMKRWETAAQDYSDSIKILNEWKSMVRY
eukprot:gb/GFBE01003791.1/.p1 GENE.gb/GFBE01003791.1/~~gb/GFBE01003791.1/.p1  ORF type:complete len:210 (+),score=73.57 gb/GFBE01003791.1/:1-630(+)